MAGRYIGQAIVQLLGDGRRVQLREPFEYVDPGESLWPVPKDAIVDGASIPRALWTIIGGPFEGKYRDASIIHDWYCDRRTRPWPSVHRMFYEAMLTSGVPLTQAKIMYAGVYWGGPRWTDTVVYNNQLGGRNVPVGDNYPAPKKPFRILSDLPGDEETAESAPGGEAPLTYAHELTESDVELLKREIGGRNLSATEIEQYVDSRMPDPFRS